MAQVQFTLSAIIPSEAALRIVLVCQTELNKLEKCSRFQFQIIPALLVKLLSA